MTLIEALIFILGTLLFVFFTTEKWKNETVFVMQLIVSSFCMMLLNWNIGTIGMEAMLIVEKVCLYTTISYVVLTVYTLFFRKKLNFTKEVKI